VIYPVKPVNGSWFEPALLIFATPDVGDVGAQPPGRFLHDSWAILSGWRTVWSSVAERARLPQAVIAKGKIERLDVAPALWAIYGKWQGYKWKEERLATE
jgi:hypothetical protein